MATFFVLFFGLITSVLLAVCCSSFVVFILGFSLVIFMGNRIGHVSGDFTVKCNGPDSGYTGADFNITIF